MAESVELNGMTINLVEDKQTYDAMTKNPNEMYLVGKDYDLVIEVEGVFYDDDAPITAEIVKGNLSALFAKYDSNPTYIGRALVKCVLEYGSSDVYCEYETVPHVLVGNSGTSQIYMNCLGIAFSPDGVFHITITKNGQILIDARWGA